MSDQKTANGIAITVRDGVAITQLAARRGAAADLEAKTTAILGVGLPLASRAVEHAGTSILWAGPGQWLVIQDPAGGADPAQDLKLSFGSLMSVVDVSDSRVMIEIARPSAGEALSRLIPLDLHDRAFPPGAVAVTQCFHLGVTLLRRSSGDVFTMLCARTYADDFLRHLRHALRISALEA